MNPRVGDGFIRVDAAGDVEYASPNALSAYRRLGLIGDLVDEHLPTLTAELLPRPRRARSTTRCGRCCPAAPSRRAELVSGDAHLMLRVHPAASTDGTRVGAIVLCRDVSDLRSKERQLVTKDATIREIHHRVKNNLQTVAALLRMQARRMTSDEARVALEDATSRVASIAIVHETLSQAFDEIVDFDQVADGLLRMVGDVSASWGGVSARREGSFGAVSADVATSLAMVVTELCQNAVEHGLADSSGEVRVVPVDPRRPPAHRDQRRRPRAAAGLRRAGSPAASGLSIVSTLVAEMKGTFTLGNRTDGPGHPGRGGHPALNGPRLAATAC